MELAVWLRPRKLELDNDCRFGRSQAYPKAEVGFANLHTSRTCQA